jgi:hypothetical protein
MPGRRSSRPRARCWCATRRSCRAGSPAVRLSEAFIKADKRVDQLCLPNRTHGFVHERYFARRMWDCFAEHLMGVAPPVSADHASN